MTVVSSSKDLEALTMTFVAEFDADLEQVWQLWADPRQLERWWGPPGYPATFTRYEFSPGGECRYHMTSPEGEEFPAYWRITSVQPPTALELEDGFADATGEPLPDPPTVMRLTLSPAGSGTRMTLASRFDSTEQLERMLKMGMEEGMRLALGQIDDILAKVA
jgi:uncharacterized protein YndB with AHSA1/START domain